MIYYDGVCGLCARIVQFVLARDATGTFRFATLQGPLGARALAANGERPLADGADPSSVMVEAADGRWLRKSRAVAFILRELGGGWRVAGTLLQVIPAPIANLGYDLVASVRYRLFGKLDRCALPRPEWRPRFLDEG